MFSPTSALAHAPEEDPTAQFDLAEQYYVDGRYEDAAEILSRLAKSFPDPILFYNLGRAHESAGQLEPAVAAYERYLALAPEAADADAVAARIGRLRERIATADAAAEPPPPVLVSPPDDSPPPETPGRRPTPWVLLGVGSAGLVAGTAVAISAVTRSREAQDEPVQARAADFDAQAQRLALAGNITIAIGGAVALAGLTWGLLRLVRNRKRTVALAPGGLRF